MSGGRPVFRRARRQLTAQNNSCAGPELKHSLIECRTHQRYIRPFSLVLLRKYSPTQSRSTRQGLVLSILLLLCAHPEVSAAQFTSYDIEVPHTPGSVHWMDERRVVFVGAALSAAPAEKRLGILHTDEARVSWGEVVTGHLCVDGNSIAYSLITGSPENRVEEQFWVIYGAFEKLSRKQVSRKDVAIGSLFFDFTYSCRPIHSLPPRPAALKGKFVKRLRPEHGFAELHTIVGEGPTKMFPVAIHGSRSEGPIGLPELKGEDLSPSWPYFKFRDAYWLTRWPRVQPAKPPGTFKSWWLKPSGEVVLAIQFDLKSTFDGVRSWVPTIPFRNGFLTTHGRSLRSASKGNLGKAGLYIFDVSGKQKLLMPGNVGAWAVSPSGCRLAIGVDERSDDMGAPQYTLRVIDVC